MQCNECKVSLIPANGFWVCPCCGLTYDRILDFGPEYFTPKFLPNVVANKSRAMERRTRNAIIRYAPRINRDEYINRIKAEFDFLPPFVFSRADLIYSEMKAKYSRLQAKTYLSVLIWLVFEKEICKGVKKQMMDILEFYFRGKSVKWYAKKLAFNVENFIKENGVEI